MIIEACATCGCGQPPGGMSGPAAGADPTQDEVMCEACKKMTSMDDEQRCQWCSHKIGSPPLGGPSNSMLLPPSMRG